MIPTTDAVSKPNPSSASLLSLPPPYTYEDLYSSYQNEWDQQLLKKNDGTTTKDHAGDIDIDIDENVSDLQWVTLPTSDGGDIHKRCNNTYLLACTGSGEVLAWKLTHSNENSTIHHLNGSTMNVHETRDSTGPKVLLEPHARLKIGCHDDYDSEADGDSVDKTYHGKLSLHEMRVVVAAAATNYSGESPPRTGKHLGRKRQRPMDGNGNKEEQKQQQLLIVAGEGGLWSIPLLDLLQQPWNPSSSSSPSPLSLLQLSDRPILKLQESPPSSSIQKQSEGCLFALEEDTNTLAMWKLSTIFEKQTTNHERRHTPPYRTIDLSRCFSGASATGGKASKSKTRRTLHDGRIGSRSSSNERATTMLIVPTLTTDVNNSTTTISSTSEYSMLVGTDRSKLWSIPIPDSKDDETTQNPRFFSLNDEGKIEESSGAEAASSRRGGSRRSSTCPIWRVTDILETNGSTWWTVSATTKGHVNADTNTGLLMTWHAPTGMMVTRQETREAIQSMLYQTSTLYTTANEGAITAWESPFRLVRKGRFWASPRSGKALASCQPQFYADDIEYTVLAVAGVGNKVDLFLHDCRIQTVQI